MTTMRPRNTGIDPSTRAPATIRPQTAIGTGFSTAARTEVQTAFSTPNVRSISIGKDTVPIASTVTANRKPMAMPKMIMAQPGPVVSTSWMKARMEVGFSGPSVTS